MLKKKRRNRSLSRKRGTRALLGVFLAVSMTVSMCSFGVAADEAMPPAEEPAVENQTVETQPAENQAAENQPVQNQPAENQPAENQPAENQEQSDVPAPAPEEKEAPAQGTGNVTESTEQTVDGANEETPKEQPAEGTDHETPAETPAEDQKQDPAAEDNDAEEKDEKEESGKEEPCPAFSAHQTVDGVVITVEAPEGVFPEGARLSVSKVSVTQEKAVEGALDAVREDTVNVAASYTFDIKVLDKEGAEVQPADSSVVKVTFRTAEVQNVNLDTQVYHIPDETNITPAAIEELPVSTAGDAAVVETSGFSFYTVEFTYNNLEYVLEGGESVALSEILAAVGLSGTAGNVEVSNSELFSAENADGTWMIHSHKAFTTTEWMKVTIDGFVYEITVTDAIPGNNVTSEIQMAAGDEKTGDFTIGKNGCILGPQSGTATIKEGTVTNNAVNGRRGGIEEANCNGSAFVACGANSFAFDNEIINSGQKILVFNIWNNASITAKNTTLNGSGKDTEPTPFLLIGGYPNGNSGTLNFTGNSSINSTSGGIRGNDKSFINVESGTLTISDSRINLRDGVKFVVKNEATLIISGSDFAQPELGKTGIEVEAGGTLVIQNANLTNTWITNSGTVKIKESDLNNCVIKNLSGSKLDISDSKLHDSVRNTDKPVPEDDGMYETMIHGENATVTLTNTEIFNNRNEYGERSQAGKPGASIISLYQGSITMDNVNAHDNTVDSNGGVMHAVDTEAVIKNSTFTNNSANTNGWQISNNYEWYGNGGALFIEDDHVTITNSTFTGNKATEGGAVSIRSDHEDPLKSKVSITDSTFENNEATRAGGALVDWGYGTTSVISGVTFRNNTAKNYGGAMGVFFDSDPKGIVISSSDNGPTQFIGNTVTEGKDFAGGGLFIDRAHVTMYDVAIYNNTAPHAGGGLSTCDVGTVEGKVLDGVAIFENNVSGRHDALPDGAELKDVYLKNVSEDNVSGKTFPHYQYELYERMFNGGLHKWDKREIGTQIVAQSDATNKDISNAKVVFRDNSVTAAENENGVVSGGGIACNGLLTIGTGTELKVVKIWDDSSNNDGYRPSPDDEIDWIKIKADGQKIDLNQNNVTFTVVEGSKADDYVLDNNIAVVDVDGKVTKFAEKYADLGDNAWLILIDGNFPRYTDEGSLNPENHTLINYTVEEDLQKLRDKYVSEAPVGDMDSYFELTNKHENEKVSISVTKVWDDGDNKDGKRPDEIQVQLTKDGAVVPDSVVTLNARNWSHTWEGLNKFEAGKEINYDVLEVADNSESPYKVSYAKTAVENGFSFTITNTELTDIAVKKVWDDTKNPGGKHPDEVTVKLLADGKETGDTLALNKANEWTGSFKGLTKYSGNNAIVYTVEETSVPSGYTAAVTGSADEGFTVTNTYTPAPTPVVEKTSIKVVKVWNDQADKDKIRPKEVTIHLAPYGERDGKEQIVTLNETNRWSAEFTDLPAKENGKPITYQLWEDTVTGYISKVEPEYYVPGQTEAAEVIVTNTHTPEKVDPPATVSVKVNKVWSDNNNAAKKRPATITVQLLADGTVTASAELSENTGWAYEFIGLPEKKDGKAIAYTVQELAVSGYTASVTGTAAGGYTITNTLGGTPAAAGSSSPASPTTGDSSHMVFWGILAVAALAGICIAVAVMRKQKREQDN